MLTNNANTNSARAQIIMDFRSTLEDSSITGILIEFHAKQIAIWINKQSSLITTGVDGWRGGGGSQNAVGRKIPLQISLQLILIKIN